MMKELICFGAVMFACGTAYAGTGPDFSGDIVNKEALEAAAVTPAAPPVAVSVSSSALSGTYKGNGLYGDMAITYRGGGYHIKTCKRYKNFCMPVLALLHPDKDSYASDKGTITVYYGDAPCAYPIALSLSSDENRLWVNDNSPIRFPKAPAGTCPPQSAIPYADYVETEAYTREK
jgi:hypothetical protein